MFEKLVADSVIYGSLLFILGLIIGSFLNVVILRLPKSLHYQWGKQCQALIDEQNNEKLDQAGLEVDNKDERPPTLAYPPSHCPRCKTTLKWWHNIPVVSFILLKGQCNSCHQRISFRYPAVEILTAVLTVVAGFIFPQISVLPWILIAIWMLISLSFIDLDTYLLPDTITLPLLWLGLIFNCTPFGFVSATNAVIGGAAGYLSLWFIYHIHRRITQREGMGHGDFKLLAAAGAWLGWQMLPIMMLISAGAGLVIALFLIIFGKHKKGDAIPFGPYIAIAFLVMMLWGPTLLASYYQWVHI